MTNIINRSFRPIIVDDVASLSGLLPEPQDGQLVQTKGFYSPGDGGGNSYIYDSASAAAVDHGKTLPGIGGSFSFDAGGSFNGVAGTGRFIATNTVSATPQQFGAPLGGSNDTFAAQTILDNNLILELPVATYSFSGLNLIDGAKVEAHQEATIQGFPDNTAVLMNAVAGNRQGIKITGGIWNNCATVLNCPTTVEMSLDNMFFEGNTAATISGTVFSLYAKDCIWRGCAAPAFNGAMSVSHFENCRWRSFTSTTRPIFEFSSVNNVKISNGWIEDNDSAALVCTGSATNLSLSSVYFESNIETAGTYGDILTFTNVGNVHLENCRFASHNQNVFTGAVVNTSGDCEVRITGGYYLLKHPQSLVASSGANQRMVYIDRPIIDGGTSSNLGSIASQRVFEDTTAGKSSLPEVGGAIPSGVGPGGVGVCRTFDAAAYFIGEQYGDINPEDRAFAVFQFVNFASLGGTQAISGKWKTSGTVRQFVLWLISSEIRLYFSTDGSGSTILNSGFTPSASAWYSMMYYFDPIAESTGIIINGTEYTGGYLQPWSAGQSNFAIGNVESGANQLDGSMARVCYMEPKIEMAGAGGYDWMSIHDYLNNSGEGRLWSDVHPRVAEQWGMKNYWNLDEASGSAIDSRGAHFQWIENPADNHIGLE